MTERLRFTAETPTHLPLHFLEPPDLGNERSHEFRRLRIQIPELNHPAFSQFGKSGLGDFQRDVNLHEAARTQNEKNASIRLRGASNASTVMENN
jgi:hypothetical protein